MREGGREGKEGTEREGNTIFTQVHMKVIEFRGIVYSVKVMVNVRELS